MLSRGLDSTRSGYNPVAVFNEDDNESSDTTKGGVISLADYRL
jgi:hypothetical protein